MTRRYRKLSDWIYYFGVLPLLALLPQSWGYFLARGQGRRFCRDQPERAGIILRNLSDSLQSQQVSAAQMQSLLERNFEIQASEDLEAFYYPFWTRRSIDRIFTVEGLEVLERLRREGKGIVLVTGHLGSFCSAVVALGLKGYPLNYLAHNSPSDPSFHPAFRAYARRKIRWMERRSGRRFILFQLGPSSSSSAEAGLTALSRLRQNELVSMAIDIPPMLAQNTATARFLESTCRFPTGFLELAYLSGSPLVPFFTWRDEGNWTRQKILIQEPVLLTGDPATDLQRCVDRLQDAIRAHPAQWFAWDSLSHFQVAAGGQAQSLPGAASR